MRSTSNAGHSGFGDLGLAEAPLPRQDNNGAAAAGAGAGAGAGVGGCDAASRATHPRPADQTVRASAAPDVVACVTHSRQQLAPLVLPVPQQVPRLALPPGDFPAGTWRCLRLLAERASHCAADDPALPGLLAQALALLPRCDCPPALLAERHCNDAADPHDAYFRIVRAAASGAAAPGLPWLRGLLRGWLCFLAEVQTGRVAPDHLLVGEALAALLCMAMGLPVATVATAQPAQPGRAAAAVAPLPRPPMALDQAVVRWVRGHQVFAVLTQGLVTGLASLQHAVAAGPADGVALALARMALLYHASAAAFRFTADFDPAHYTGAIRLSMSEPHVPSGFSGTLSSDHGHLVRQLAASRQVLARARQQCPAGYAAMGAALSRVYDDHRNVCEHFDGAQRPSLLASSHSSGHAAADMLDRFKARRVDMLR